MKYRFKEVKLLPEQYFDRSPKYVKMLIAFLKSDIGIADITGLQDIKDRSYFVHMIRRSIYKLNLVDKVFVTNRQKKVYLVNIRVSGLRYSKRKNGMSRPTINRRNRLKPRADLSWKRGVLE